MIWLIIQINSLVIVLVVCSAIDDRIKQAQQSFHLKHWDLLMRLRELEFEVGIQRSLIDVLQDADTLPDAALISEPGRAQEESKK